MTIFLSYNLSFSFLELCIYLSKKNSEIQAYNCRHFEYGCPSTHYTASTMFKCKMESALIVLLFHCGNNIYQTMFASYNMLILIMHNKHCEMLSFVSTYYNLILLCISKTGLYREISMLQVILGFCCYFTDPRCVSIRKGCFLDETDCQR